MDSLLTSLPGKSEDSKPRMNQATKIGTGEAQRQNRVFGTAKSTNIIHGKPVWDKSITKTNIGVSQRQPKSKSIRTSQLPIETSTKTNDKNVNPGLNKKSETFPQKVSQEKSCSPKTPITSSWSHVRSKSSTPFYSALNCSKCRFDKLETSSYWVSQIKMAESVGKHFVASEFFKLALVSQAEPIRNLRMELKRYLSRHGYLSEQKEWREVGDRYGILKFGSNNTGMDSSTTPDQSKNVT